MGPEIAKGSADGTSGASSARPDSADRDGARNGDFVGEGGQRSHSRAGGLPTARGRQPDRAVAERDQFADTPSGVCAPEEGVLGPPLVGEGVSCRQHGESDERDGARVY